MVAAFAIAASGCLSSIIPEHQASSGADAGTQTGTGGGGGSDTPAPTANATDDGGIGDGGVAQSANDPNCIAKAAAVIDGHHNAGQPCLQCHDGNTAGANKFTAAGTVYDKLSLAAGAQGLSGVTIEITDANGAKVSVVTASQGAPGNFWTDTPLVFPLKVRASQCPADRPMADPLAAAANVGAGGGNCSRAGCHDANMIVHVP
ncbi:MAG: hypothetical protein JWM53_4335, partial [bacterium]|nr:hypothetical protein [bacterium]